MTKTQAAPAQVRNNAAYDVHGNVVAEYRRRGDGWGIGWFWMGGAKLTTDEVRAINALPQVAVCG